MHNPSFALNLFSFSLNAGMVVNSHYHKIQINYSPIVNRITIKIAIFLFCIDELHTHSVSLEP